MKNEILVEIIDKLNGPIIPVGETNEDKKRFENLVNMCYVIDELMEKIMYIKNNFSNHQEFSIKKANLFSEEFLTKYGLFNITQEKLN